MLRKDVETYMKAHNLTTMVIVINENDRLGLSVSLHSGYLYNDYTGSRVDRKTPIWGYITFEKGKPIRHAFE